MKLWVKIPLLVLLFGLLVLVRFLEGELFYDPLRDFFKQDYLHQKVPDLHLGKLLLHTAYRYLLNTAVSLLILYVAFRDRGVVLFSMLLYGVAFFVLLPCMGWLVANASPESNYNILFYVRRFLIQPIFVLLLLPAFYYQKQK